VGKVVRLDIAELCYSSAAHHVLQGHVKNHSKETDHRQRRQPDTLSRQLVLDSLDDIGEERSGAFGRDLGRPDGNSHAVQGQLALVIGLDVGRVDGISVDFVSTLRKGTKDNQ